MVTVSGIDVRRIQHKDGVVESEAQVTAADGDVINASDLELLYISYFKSIQPLASGHVPGAGVVTNADSHGNSGSLELYSKNAGGSLVAAGSVDWLINAMQR